MTGDPEVDRGREVEDGEDGEVEDGETTKTCVVSSFSPVQCHRTCGVCDE